MRGLTSTEARVMREAMFSDENTVHPESDHDVIERLVARGLLRQEPDPKDPEEWLLVYVTPMGRAIFTAARTTT